MLVVKGIQTVMVVYSMSRMMTVTIVMMMVIMHRDQRIIMMAWVRMVMMMVMIHRAIIRHPTVMVVIMRICFMMIVVMMMPEQRVMMMVDAVPMQLMRVMRCGHHAVVCRVHQMQFMIHACRGNRILGTKNGSAIIGFILIARGGLYHCCRHRGQQQKGQSEA